MLLKFAKFAFLILSSTRDSSCNSCAYFYIAPLLYAVCSLKRELHLIGCIFKKHIYDTSTYTQIKLTSISKDL